MRGAFPIFKLVAALITLAFLLGLAWWVDDFSKKFAGTEAVTARSVEEIIEDSAKIDFEPSQHDFNRALELIALGQIEKARTKLTLIENLYPDSSHAPEARRILGEINLDAVLSVENMSNKRTHRVAPGEGYLRIATANQTTLDAIMFLNGLTELGSLHAGDELVVMPLDFKLVLNLPRNRLELYHRDAEKKEHVFAKDYPIQKIVGNPLQGRSRQALITRKVGEHVGRTYPPTHESYRHAAKVLGLKAGRVTLQLRSLPKKEEEEVRAGIYLSAPDMEELAMLIRIGNEVEVISAQ